MKDQTRLIPMSYTNMSRASDYAILHKNAKKMTQIKILQTLKCNTSEER